ncbi:MAG: aminotransferase class V-fold PLP-dependent enzyme [Fuerstiella sp.]|nr:aminotransferase class V-fold PLP-dependent enzyme [Fuerstiella sp.]
MQTEPLLPTNLFVGLDGITHLCAGGEAPWLCVHDRAYREFSRLKSAGIAGREGIAAFATRCRQQIAELWSVSPQHIAFMPSASEGMNWLARGLDWKSEDNVVTSDVEFPSVAYAWKNCEHRQVEVRMVRQRNGIVRESDLLDAVDERTRVMAVSQVSFYSGQCLNVPLLAEGLQKNGALLAVDATHASGVLRVPSACTDLTVSSSYKWMLGAHGVAPCYVSPRMQEQMKVTCFGWHNMDGWSSPVRRPGAAVQPMPDRMEPGNPSIISLAFLDGGLSLLLDLGMERIEHHVRDLASRLRLGLVKQGHTLLGPDQHDSLSGNTCFAVDDAAALAGRLAQNRILCWGDCGRLRVSTHVYNGSDDVDHFLNVLPETG